MQSYFRLIHMLSKPLKIFEFIENLLDFAKTYRINNKSTCTSMKYEHHNYMRKKCIPNLWKYFTICLFHAMNIIYIIS